MDCSKVGSLILSLRKEKGKKELQKTELIILIRDYYIPDLKLPEKKCLIGKYARMHRNYLKEVHPARYSALLLTG